MDNILAYIIGWLGSAVLGIISFCSKVLHLVIRLNHPCPDCLLNGECKGKRGGCAGYAAAPAKCAYCGAELIPGVWECPGCGSI